MGVLRVLVVDDNAPLANSMSRLLRRWGHDVRAAHDGPEALAVAAEFRPDVALLDLALPGMDGYEVGRQLRALPGLEALTLLALTGYDEAEYPRRSEEEGFAAHLVKPVDPPKLDSLLNGLARERAGNTPPGEVSG
jgi:CheY-like chemotaxis protein